METNSIGQKWPKAGLSNAKGKNNGDNRGGTGRVNEIKTAYQ